MKKFNAWIGFLKFFILIPIITIEMAFDSMKIHFS